MLALSSCLAGCWNSSNEVPRSFVKKIDVLSLRSQEDYQKSLRCCADICELVAESSPSLRVKMLDLLRDRFLTLEFDESSYRKREDSMADYFQLVSAMSEKLLTIDGMNDAVWRFKLAVLDRINNEIRRCDDEPLGGPYGDVSAISRGFFMTQRLYLEALKAKRFDFIRNGFEYGPFTLYFQTLSAESRRQWIEMLKRVAQREVCILLSPYQLAEMPRYQPDEDEISRLTFTSNGIPEYVEALGGGRFLRWRVVTNSIYYQKVMLPKITNRLNKAHMEVRKPMESK